MKTKDAKTAWSLVLEPRRAWTGQLVLFDRKVRVLVEARTEATRDARVEGMRSTLGAALEAGLQEIVKLYEDSWSDGRSVTRALAKIQMRQVHIDATGKYAVTLSDGGLFGGHTVLLNVTKAGRVSLSLAG